MTIVVVIGLRPLLEGVEAVTSKVESLCMSIAWGGYTASELASMIWKVLVILAVLPSMALAPQ